MLRTLCFLTALSLAGAVSAPSPLPIRTDLPQRQNAMYWIGEAVRAFGEPPRGTDDASLAARLDARPAVTRALDRAAGLRSVSMARLGTTTPEEVRGLYAPELEVTSRLRPLMEALLAQAERDCPGPRCAAPLTRLLVTGRKVEDAGGPMLVYTTGLTLERRGVERAEKLARTNRLDEASRRALTEVLARLDAPGENARHALRAEHAWVSTNADVLDARSRAEGGHPRWVDGRMQRWSAEYTRELMGLVGPCASFREDAVRTLRSRWRDRLVPVNDQTARRDEPQKAAFGDTALDAHPDGLRCAFVRDRDRTLAALRGR